MRLSVVKTPALNRVINLVTLDTVHNVTNETGLKFVFCTRLRAVLN